MFGVDRSLQIVNNRTIMITLLTEDVNCRSPMSSGLVIATWGQSLSKELWRLINHNVCQKHLEGIFSWGWKIIFWIPTYLAEKIWISFPILPNIQYTFLRVRVPYMLQDEMYKGSVAKNHLFKFRNTQKFPFGVESCNGPIQCTLEWSIQSSFYNFHK